MARTANVFARVEPELKEQAESIQPPLSGDLPADRRRPGNGLQGI